MPVGVMHRGIDRDRIYILERNRLEVRTVAAAGNPILPGGRRVDDYVVHTARRGERKARRKIRRIQAAWKVARHLTVWISHSGSVNLHWLQTSKVNLSVAGINDSIAKDFARR